MSSPVSVSSCQSPIPHKNLRTRNPPVKPKLSGRHSRKVDKVRRRIRAHHSCEPCRQRKVKCDRTQDCANCRLRSVKCEWSEAVPTEESTESLLFRASDEISRLRTLVQLLLQAQGLHISPALALVELEASVLLKVPASSASEDSDLEDQISYPSFPQYFDNYGTYELDDSWPGYEVTPP